MPDRGEALERTRLARMRQQLGVDRNDNTSLRSFANEALREPLMASSRGVGISTLAEDEQQRREQAMSAAATGLLTAPLGFVAGEAARQVLPEGDLTAQEQERVLKERFGGLDQTLREDGKLLEQARSPEFASTRQQALPSALKYGSSWDLDAGDAGDFIGNEAGAIASLAGRDPSRPTSDDFAQAVAEWERYKAERPLSPVDWDATGRELGRGIPDRVATVTNIPEMGADIGGFSRGWSGPGADNHVAYTVVPNANSSRFSQRLAPAAIDQVYRKDLEVSGGSGKFRPKGDVDNLLDTLLEEERPRPVPRNRMASLKQVQRLGLLEAITPGQIFGRNQSGYLWGTLTEHPRYEYAGEGGAKNPEILVSEVRTPPELETRYLFTGDTRDPRVRYKNAPDTKALGPSWGVSEQPVQGQLAGRRKRNTAGDISFRGDLIERRGGFSLADAQAVQNQLGLPVSFDRDGRSAAKALEDAVESIRVAEGLPSHAAVIDKHARSLPRLGSTTAPRQPATGRLSAMPLDTSLGVTSNLRRAFDLPGALTEAGYEPNRIGLKQANADIRSAARGRVSRLNNAIRVAPAFGTALSFADPEAANLLGTALREEGPTRTGLLADAARVYGQNALIGGVQGGLVSGALAAAPRLGLGALATTAATGLGVASPALAGMAVVQTADGYLKGATGEDLGQHWRKFQELRYGTEPAPQVTSKPLPPGMQQARKATDLLSVSTGGSGIARQVIPQIVPTPKPVTANTSSGVAQLKAWTPPRNQGEALLRETGNRLRLAGQNFNPLKGDFGLSELLFGRSQRK